ncbi:uncharacterized [Tachysurus ichikawai]
MDMKSVRLKCDGRVLGTSGSVFADFCSEECQPTLQSPGYKELIMWFDSALELDLVQRSRKETMRTIAVE